MLDLHTIDRRQFLGQCAAGAAAAGIVPSLASAAKAAPAKAAPTAPLAMWALTGTLKSADVVRQLDAYAAAGWGVVLYPRSGLEIEYLSDAWFERIRFIVEQCAARSIEVWLYDEYCWPSGHAKGLVTQGHPEFEAQVLSVARDGRSEIQRVPGSANLLRADATRRFLDVTHERYAAAVGKYFGNTVRAIFTDEPSLSLYHRPRKKGDTAWRVLWSDGLDRALGGDFRQRLAAAGTGAAEPRLWRDYWAAYARLYHDAWTMPIARWCAEHKIALSGHLLGENDFGSHVTNYGSLRLQLNEFQAPGIDEISTRWEVDRCEAMTLATIAEYPGRERMVEVFALGPCHMRMETMKRMVDLCAACGVDRYVMAICPFDLRGGIEKRGYLGVHNMLQPWWRDYARPWADYLAEVAQRARQAKPLGVPWPSDEELWAVAGPDPRRSKPLQQISKTFTDAAREVIRSRMPAAPVTTTRPQQKLDAHWTFAPRELNSLRLDDSSLLVVDVPRVAELSVQTQLVRSLRINGQALDLAAAPADTRFDLSYVRLPIAKLLREGQNTFEVQSTEPKPLPFLPALILWGNFAVDAERRLVAPKQAIALGDWRTQGYPTFCGTGCYRTTVEWAKAPARLGVASSDYPTRVLVNGRECGRRPWAPFDFDLRGAARPGKNQIVIEIASTVGHLFVPEKAPSMDLSQLWAVRNATVSPPIGLLDVWVSG